MGKDAVCKSLPGANERFSAKLIWEVFSSQQQQQFRLQIIMVPIEYCTLCVCIQICHFVVDCASQKTCHQIANGY